MKSFTEQIDALFAENKGAEAESLMLQTLAETEAKQAWEQMVPVLNELIGYCRETGQAERSYEYGQRALEVLHKLSLQGSVPYATTLLNIANAYRAGGRLEDSLQTYEQVAAIYKEQVDAENMLWANFYNNLSLLYQEMNRFDLAKESLLKALSIVICKPDTIFEQAVTYTNLANTCLELKQGEEAQKYFTGAILLFEKYNIKDSHYCAALAAMGTYFYQEKQYDKAGEYFEKAMAGIEASLGRNEYYYRMQENVRLCQEMQRGMQSRSGKACPEADGGEPGEAVRAEAVDNVVLPKKGLKLCREYYEAYGKPMLEKDFPQYINRIAVGLVGEGSDCFGYDDGFSMDHDWGPRFMMWISRETYEEIGEQLEAAYQKLPKEFQGYEYKESRQGVNRRGVFVIQEFFAGLLGEEISEGLDWRNIPQERLAAATNGEIFSDPEGIFTQIHSLLKKQYPQWLRYTHMAESVAKFSRAGQYNYGRVLKRGDSVTAQLMCTEAIKEALKLLYYVAEEYPPHDKWLYRGLAEKEEYTQILELIEQTISAEAGHKEFYMEEIAKALALLLYQRDIISDVEPYLEAHVGELLFKANASKLSGQELAEKIAGLEFEAFDKVKNYGGRADCQDDWFTFSIMRKSQYYTWDKTMLLQYYYDFTREFEKGHNLIEEKYGRMMESTAPGEYVRICAGFPAISHKKRQIIESVVGMQVAWMEAFAAEYPRLAGNARSIHTYEDHLYNTSYETYLRGEISTYSDKMLELYGRYIVNYAKNGGNPAKDIMEHSVLMYGYEGLDAAEQMMS